MSAPPAWLEGFTAFDDEPAPLVPILLLDAFTITRVGASAIRCAVIGCVSGELRLVPESHVHHLPKLLLEAWRRVESRSLRSVRAEDFVLCTMDAFSTTSTSWQIWLRAMVHVRIAHQEVHLEPLHAHGQIAVPSAVAEVAVRWSATEAFDNPRAAGEVTHHWWLPTLNVAQTRAGQGLLLVYTLPDPAMFEGADNQAVQRRLEVDFGVSENAGDELGAALEALLSGAIPPNRLKPRGATLEPLTTNATLKPPVNPVVVVPLSRAAGTLEPPAAYKPLSPTAGKRAANRVGQSGRDWSSDFAISPTSQRATQSAWWRDFAPNAIGVDGFYKARGSSAAFEKDFE